MISKKSILKIFIIVCTIIFFAPSSSAEKILLTNPELDQIYARSTIILSVYDLQIDQHIEALSYVDPDDGGAIVMEDVSTSFTIHENRWQDVLRIDVAKVGKPFFNTDTPVPTVITQINDLHISNYEMSFTLGVHDDTNLSDGIRELENDEKFGEVHLKGEFRIADAKIYITAH